LGRTVAVVESTSYFNPLSAGRGVYSTWKHFSGIFKYAHQFTIQNLDTHTPLKLKFGFRIDNRLENSTLNTEQTVPVLNPSLNRFKGINLRRINFEG